MREYYTKHRDKLIVRAATWRKANPESRKEICRRWAKKNPEKLKAKAKRKYWSDPEKHRALASKNRRKLWLECLTAYGGRCACCAESQEVFLTIEHKNRDGKAHRAAVGHSRPQIIRDLRKRGWPDDCEILCFNCNRASWELGTCPHRQKEGSVDGQNT